LQASGPLDSISPNTERCSSQVFKDVSRRMKILNSRMLICLILLALLVGSNGCMTQSAIKYAKGHPEKAWINNSFGYANLPTDPKSKPHPAYYVLLPLSAPADVATSPFQLIGLWWDYSWNYIIGHEGGGTP
jgi:hypothetical protein